MTSPCPRGSERSQLEPENRASENEVQRVKQDHWRAGNHQPVHDPEAIGGQRGEIHALRDRLRVSFAPRLEHLRHEAEAGAEPCNHAEGCRPPRLHQSFSLCLRFKNTETAQKFPTLRLYRLNYAIRLGLAHSEGRKRVPACAVAASDRAVKLERCGPGL